MAVLEIYLGILTNFFEILHPPLRKCNSIMKDGEISRKESKTNKDTIKQIKICSEKSDRNNIKIK